MSNHIETIIDYFEQHLLDEHQWGLSVEVIRLINALDNPSRRELRDRLFNVAKEKELKFPDADVLDWLHECFLKIEEHTFRMHEVYFSPGFDIVDNLRDLIQQAKSTIDICVFSFTDDRLARSIRKAMDAGVQIRIITDDLKTLDRGSKINWLNNLGIEIKIDQAKAHMHNKFGVIDRRISFTGSFNWTKSASRANNENLLVTTNHTIVQQFTNEFERLWKEMYIY